MKADEIARYLQDNPGFFDEYADLLAPLCLPHPHGGRAISITERQILTLREKAKQLEGKLGELIRFGEENDAIGEKVHRLATALAGARDFAGVRHVLLTHLGGDGQGGEQGGGQRRRDGIEKTDKLFEPEGRCDDL